MEFVVKLPSFKEEMIVKEDSIKIGEEEELKKEADHENNVTVDRLVDRTQRAVDMLVDCTQ